MALQKKRKQLNVSMEMKFEALKRLDKGESVNKLMLELGVGRTTLLGWKKNRSNIELWCSKRLCSESVKGRKNMKGGEYEKVSEALYLWFRSHRESGTPISGPLLQEKALKFYEEFKEGEPGFTASIGWLDRWKKRYGVRQLNICGEKLSAEIESVNEFKKRLHCLIEKEGLSGDQVYNCDESGLYIKALPTQTLASQHEKSAPGYKRSKERLTILACSNVTGEHKLKLCLIGKSKNPRPFKNVKKSSDDSYDLPVWYRNQKSAWMDGYTFQQWFSQQFVPSVEKFLKQKGLPRKALLVLDNASTHPDVEHLQNGEIKALFLPPNVTSLCQPMDQGVLQTVKKIYRRKLLSSIIQAIDGGMDVIHKLKKIDLLDVVGWISQSWEEVPAITLVRSWRKLLDHAGNEFEEKKDSEGDLNLVDLLRRVPGAEEATEEDVENWMQEDGNSEPLGDSEIVLAVTEKDRIEDGSEDEDGDDVAEEKMSHSDGLQAVEGALRYFEQHGASAADILFLRRLRDDAAHRRSQSEKQSKITRFFPSQ